MDNIKSIKKLTSEPRLGCTNQEAFDAINKIENIKLMCYKMIEEQKMWQREAEQYAEGYKDAAQNVIKAIEE